MKNNEEIKNHGCGCGDNCTCGDNCNCNDEHRCNEQCDCNTEHSCGCGDDCSCHGKEAEYLELAQRIKAEFDNYKRRNADVVSQSFNNGVATTVTKLLPAIDSFRQARVNIKDEDVLKGVEMIEGLILKGLSELGVEKIEAINKEFDPRYHNAVLTGQDDSKDDGIVLEEYQEGFMLNGKVIRPSAVKINKL